MRMSPAEFERAVADAVESLPPRFKQYLDRIVIDVEARPTPDDCRELGVDDPSELFGTYFGTPLTERQLDEPPALPDRIVIYQKNVETVCKNRKELVREIAVTVLHEIGHHFGLDEDDLETLGYD